MAISYRSVACLVGVRKILAKAAAARARKATLELEKLGKAFRKQSIAEL